MHFVDPVTGLKTGSPLDDPFAKSPEFSAPVSAEDLGLILSASGWRGVFAAGDEDESDHIRPTMRIAALAMAVAAGEYFLQNPADTGDLLVGLDARPTGPALADIFIRTFTSLGLTCRYLFITPAPEIMAAARDSDRYRGFCYLSASHNPVGHNGVKLGTTDGGVISGPTARPVIARIISLLAAPAELEAFRQRQHRVDHALLTKIYNQVPSAKAEASAAYRNFSTQVVFESSASAVEELKNNLKAAPLGIVAELNGSARGAGIDQDYFASLGVKTRFYNHHPREIRHAILPEGEALFPCRDLLEQAYREDSAFQLGYVPDNDGDRGNIVYIDPADGSGHVLDAQQVFALSVLAELAYHRVTGAGENQPHSVVVNGPTSLRVDRLAAFFGVSVVRAEVGEANVVNLARELRQQGHRVRILGEGSNGGTIIHPSSVRDPLNSVCSLIKLLRYRNHRGVSPAEEWFRLAGIPVPASEITIPQLLASLPAFLTTPTDELRAKYPVRSLDHNRLKSAYEDQFALAWPQRPGLLDTLGIAGYRFVNYEGTHTRPGAGNRSDSGRGGFKVELISSTDESLAFLWMRGSGTEPVFRILVDLPGIEADRELNLIDWHRGILAMADEQASV